MKRLFVSLYFAIILGILLIGWGSDKIWEYVQPSSDTDIERIAKLSKSLVPLLNNNVLSLKELSQQLGMEIELFDADQIAWLEADEKKLNMGEPILTYNADNQLTIILKLNSQQQLLQIGPIDINPDKAEIRQYLLIASYIFLGAIIALWTWPLWRDLRLLQSSAKQFGTGHFDGTIPVGKSSVIYPLVKTFQAMAEQISRLIEEQRQLSNAVSHDLRTPLSRLKFSIAMLKDNADQVEDMKQDVDEIEKLVDEVLSYGRLENKHQHINYHQVNITELLHNQIEKLQRGTDKHLQLAVDDNLFCHCDGHLIERAIQNLINNGIRYGDNEVHISASHLNNDIVIHVDDDGEGIDILDRKQIFKPFIRLEKSRNKAKGGFGLGLAIVQRILQWHNGQCLVDGSPLGGARFTLQLPINTDEY